MKPDPHLLIVDDDPAVAQVLAKSLGRHGFIIDTARTPDEAMELAEGVAYDAALLDLVMPGRGGTALAAELRAKIPGLSVAMLTGYPNSPLIAEAQRSGVRVFTKPPALEDLLAFFEEEIA